MGGPIPRDPARQQRSVFERLDELDSRIGRAIPGRLTDFGRGPTSERDVLYGVPTTLADQVALANRRVVWFNTDFGWEESYYAPAGSAGLTPRGLLPGADAGWYPTGEGPQIQRGPSTTAAAISGNTVGGWNTIIRDTGGPTWFTDGTELGRPAGFFVVPKRAGFYDFSINLTLTNGSGTANFWHAHWAVGGNTYKSSRGYPKTLGAYYESLIMDYKMHLALPNELLALVCHAGSLTVHVGNNGGLTPWDNRGEFHVRYVAPPLVSA